MLGPLAPVVLASRLILAFPQNTLLKRGDVISLLLIEPPTTISDRFLSH